MRGHYMGTVWLPPVKKKRRRSKRQAASRFVSRVSLKVITLELSLPRMRVGPSFVMEDCCSTIKR